MSGMKKHALSSPWLMSRCTGQIASERAGDPQKHKPSRN
jgi:hypothetical protein